MISMGNILRAKDAGIPGNGGHFAGHPHDAGAVTLSPVALLTASGHRVEVTPGVLDDKAVTVLTEGQCVALAVAVAERLEIGSISVLTETDGGETRVVHAWVEAPAGGGQPIDSDSQMIDGNGAQCIDQFLQGWYENRSEPCFDCEDCEEGLSYLCEKKTDGEEGMEVDSLTLHDARSLNKSELGAGLPPQDWDLVATFVDPILEKSAIA